jgi:hypothetical protein
MTSMKMRKGAGRRTGDRRRTVDLGFEQCENRLLLATFTVTNTNASGAGSLSDAINSANTADIFSPTQLNSITFNIPGTGPFVINLSKTPLPTIQYPVTIDGTSQPGYVGTPLIEIDGDGVIVGDGLVLTNQSFGSTIKGLDIADFGGAAIHVQTANNLIVGNFLGTDPTGTSAGPGDSQGVWIDGAPGNTIGGTAASAANVIGFNQGLGWGVNITGSSIATLVEGNFIGTNAAGANLGNQYGVFIAGGTGDTIGGTVAGSANVIGNNTVNGVEVAGATATLVEGNFIGTDPAGDKLGNGVGVGVLNSTGTTIGGTVSGAGNTIANNSGAVDISGSGAAIRENLIYGNVTSISAGSGATLPAAPSIGAVASVPGLTTIDYTVTGTVGQAYSIDFFASTSVGGPAAEFLGTLTTPALTSATQSFTATFNPGQPPIPSNQAVTATSTDPNNNTSLFATAVAPRSPFVVTNTNDGVPGGAVGSLRQAILDANTSPGSTITFAIPGTGPFVINTATALPAISVKTKIDGTSQPGYAGTPIVELDGGGAGFDGLQLGTGSDNSTIEGLDIVGYGDAGIELVSGADLVASNFIGPDPSGKAAGPGNHFGILVDSGGNVIGGTTSGAANVIGFSNSTFGVGVYLADAAAAGNLVEGNFIGTDPAGHNLGNTSGIFINLGSGNTIGGTFAAAANVIGFSSGAAVEMLSTTATLVEGNFIGTDPAGARLGNALGVLIANFSAHTTIGGTVAGAGNTIAFNFGPAVDVFTGSGNTFRENLIYGNAQAIVVNSGANNNQAAPSNLAVASVPGLTTIDYTITGTVGQAYTIDFFASNSLGGPAAVFLGTVTTPALTSATQAFTATFNLATPLASGQQVTATATDPNNDTSPFATAVAPASPFLVTNTNDNVPGGAVGSLRQAILDANTSPGSTITFAISSADPFVITPASALPAITAAVTIDGTSQPGFYPNDQPLIELQGQNQGFDGLILGPGSGESTIQALDLAGFGGAGIHIESSGNAVLGCDLGTDVTGTAAGPGDGVGVWIDGGLNNTVGGTVAAAANTIGFNATAGVSISGSSATGNQVLGDDIGTDAEGDNLANAAGVVVSGGASGNGIGGTARGAADTIADNTGAAVHIVSGSGNSVRADLIYGNGSAIVVDPGANGNPTAPSIVSVVSNPGQTTIAYTVTGTVGVAYTIDFFAGAGAVGPAAQFLGSVTTPVLSSSAPQTFTAQLNLAVPLASDQPVSATSTSPTGDTSGLSGTSASVSVITYTVNSTADDGSAGTLRAAIQAVNKDTSSAADTIIFNLAGAGPFTIGLASPLTISHAVILNALGGPVIEIQPASAAASEGIVLAAGSDGSTIEGLEIAGFTGPGVDIRSSGDTLKGNFIEGNGQGVLINGTGNTIGGTSAVAANTIAGNVGAAVDVASGNGDQIRGNPIYSNGQDIALASPVNRPILSQAVYASGATTLTAQVSGYAPNAKVVLDFYAYVTAAQGPAQFYLGSYTSNVDATGGATFTGIPIPTYASGEQYIVATATGPVAGTSQFTSTSEFTASPAPLVIKSSSPEFEVNSIQEVEGKTTLADAIANLKNSPPARGTTDIITFNIPTVANSTVVIPLDSALDIAYPVTIYGPSEGYNNPGARIELEGNGGASDGLVLEPNSDGSVIQRLDFIGFGDPRAPIGTTANAGLVVESTGDKILTDVFEGNQVGVLIDGAAGSSIAASVQVSGDQFSGNHAGILIGGAAASKNAGDDQVLADTFTGNVQAGILIDGASGSTIGGTSGDGNTFVGNTSAGVSIVGASATGNVVIGNRIGVASGPANGDGVDIGGGASDNTIGGKGAGAGNTIAGNTGSAVHILSGSGNSILQDLIERNGQAIVVDPGANDGLNAPMGLAATSNPDASVLPETIDYTVTGVVGDAYTVEFFAGDSSNGPASRFLGSVKTPVLTSASASFTASFDLTAALAVGEQVTATVTAPDGSTSEFAASAAAVSPFVVTLTTDWHRDATTGQPTGPEVGSLRLAINDANLDPISPITFDFGGAPASIDVVTALPTIVAKVTIAGPPGPAGAPSVVIDGRGGKFDGLTLGVGSGGSMIEGLGIEDFNGDGILVESQNNTIGGSIAGDGDVISGNTGDGIRIMATGNHVEGDLIGTDASGTFALPNGAHGIEIQANSNTIGGSIAGARGAISGPGNLISGNKNDGILIEASGNVVEGDFIGTNASGTGPLLYQVDGQDAPPPQVNGVVVQSPDNTIGGPTAAYGNLISGNQNDGVMVGNIGIHVANNTIGTNIAGNGPVPNVGNGVEVAGTSNAPAAPPAADPDAVSYNLISDNSGNGILLDNNASGVQVQSNTIGTDVSGAIAQPNANGVKVSGVEGNTIGGSTPDLGNTISGNTNGIGIYILNGGATGNTVEGNLIGTTLNGNGAVGNSIGISISNAPNNLIGGLTATAGTGVGNVITGNTSIGIEISNNSSSGNRIEGNLLGLYKDGKHFFSEPDMLTTGIPIGILIDNAPNNSISGAIAADGSIVGAGDVITGFGVGVDISGFNATGNVIEGDRIGTTRGGAMIAGGPGIGIGVYINDVPSNTVGGSTAGAGNTIMGYSYYGVYIYGTLAHGNVIQGNRIGPPAVKNKGELAGIAIDGASDNVLGGSASSAGNTISGNAYAGIYIFGSSASGNVIRQNHLEHNGYGILLYNAINNGGYATLLNRNRFVRDGIANVRIFQGAVPSGQVSSHRARSKGHKSSLHVASHQTRLHHLRVRPASSHPEVVPADRAGGRTEIHDPAPHRDPASATEPARTSLRRRVRPTTVVPGGPLALRTLARLNRPPSAAGHAGRATDRSAS